MALSEAARDAGADAIMVTPPFYRPIDQETQKRFFRAIADADVLPLWLYHHPPTTWTARVRYGAEPSNGPRSGSTIPRWKCFPIRYLI